MERFVSPLRGPLTFRQAGGCRTDIPAGEFTVNDAYTLLPFSNTIFSLEMTGAEIKAVLEDCIEYTVLSEGQSTGPYPYAFGLRWDLDLTKAFGERFTNVEINSRMEQPQWAPLDLGASYVVATNSFIAAGRDGYDTFATIDATKVVNTYIEYAQIFVDYATTYGVIEAPPLSAFSTQRYVDIWGCDHSTSFYTGCLELNCADDADCAEMPGSSCRECHHSSRKRKLRFGYALDNQCLPSCAVDFA